MRLRVTLGYYPENKIKAVKAVREAFGFGLREAKNFVERANEGTPVVLTVTQLQNVIACGAVASASHVNYCGVSSAQRGPSDAIQVTSVEPYEEQPLILDVAELMANLGGTVWQRVFNAA